MSENDAVASTQRVRARDKDALVMSEVVDPRPDIVEDSWLWERLLKMAFLDHGDHWGTNVYAMLHGMRCCGMKLDLNEGKPGYRLVPWLTKQKVDPGIEPLQWPPGAVVDEAVLDHEETLVPPHGVGDDSQWVFEAHYKKDREAALLPHREDIMALLKRMWDEEMAEGDL